MDELQVVKHNGMRVLLTNQLADRYGTTNKVISNNFNNNRAKYQEGKHYYLLKGKDLREFRSKSYNLGIANNMNKLYLWTERGAFLHAKSLNTSEAWEVYDLLVEHYFKSTEVKPIINDSYMIEDPIERAKRWIEEETERQNLRLENKELINEVIHKEDVIGGFVDDIDLAEKRRRITQIIRYGSDKYSERYNLLYREFEMKYKMDLNRRMNSDQYKSIKPKIKNKMDLIDRGLHKIPQLYEIACKLFENDVAKLQQEIWDTCEGRHK